ncbi:MAG: HIT domain-containing protein [Nanoarchaeota archaeon]|nr:HIT domain-containing protein [Nanoarchaeota archaeon]MBU4308734.1 HIT domain-containing protein [Nanoarchaeota archaeon]
MDNCILCNLDPNKNPTFIKEFEHWALLINYMQPTLGSSLIVLKRHVSDFSDLTEKEHLEYFNIAKQFEKVTKDSFGSNKFNYFMLANVVEHVHYHVVPRYREKVFFDGLSWKDNNYGKSLTLSSNEKSHKILIPIIKKIQGGFNKP